MLVMTTVEVSVIHKEVLRACRNMIIEGLAIEMGHILQRCIDYEVITKQQSERKIVTKETAEDQCGELIDIIGENGRTGFDKFVDVLKINHGHIAEFLEQSLVTHCENVSKVAQTVMNRKKRRLNGRVVDGPQETRDPEPENVPEKQAKTNQAECANNLEQCRNVQIGSDNKIVYSPNVSLINIRDLRGPVNMHIKLRVGDNPPIEAEVNVQPVEKEAIDVIESSRENKKRLEEVLSGCGMALFNVKQGSIVLQLDVTDKEKAKNLIKDFHSGELTKTLVDALLTDEMKEKYRGKEIDVKLTIDASLIQALKDAGVDVTPPDSNENDDQGASSRLNTAEMIDVNGHGVDPINIKMAEDDLNDTGMDFELGGVNVKPSGSGFENSVYDSLSKNVVLPTASEFLALQKQTHVENDEDMDMFYDAVTKQETKEAKENMTDKFESMEVSQMETQGSGVTASTDPGKPEVWKVSPIRVGLKWAAPEIRSSFKVCSYTLRWKDSNSAFWQTMSIPASEDDSTSHEETALAVPPNNTYIFAVIAHYEGDTTGDFSKASDPITISATADEIVKARVLETSTSECLGNQIVHQIKIESTFESDDGMIKKYQYGAPNLVSESVSEKVIMIVGATGAGKSTLINGMINYLFGIKWEDTERLKLIPEKLGCDQSESQTKSITSYTVYHQKGLKVPYTVTIIDTPGFGDTKGYSRDEQITRQIREFFTSIDADGLDHIEAVGFVTQSSLPRLTPTQIYIFDKILSLFGKDIKDNILMLLTFADGQKPQVLSGIEKAGFEYSAYLKFNNSAVFAEKGNDAENEAFNKMFWEMGEKSFKSFFDTLGSLDSKSLTLTKAVLTERHQLELLLLKMCEDIKLGLNKLENLTNELKVVAIYEAEIAANKEFRYTVMEEKIVKKDAEPGKFTTNCLTCNRTCHVVCTKADDEMKWKCTVMDRETGNCTVCPQHCHWKSHRNMPFIMTIQRKKVTKTSKELKERYQKGVHDKLTVDKLIKSLQDDFNEHQLNTLLLTDEMRRATEYINKIALKPNPLSTLDYIDLMIEAEKAECKPGYMERIQELNKLRERVEVFVKTVHNREDPFSDYIDRVIDSEKKEQKSGFSERILTLEKLKETAKFAIETTAEEIENIDEEYPLCIMGQGENVLSKLKPSKLINVIKGLRRKPKGSKKKQGRKGTAV
ncbi:unnamed protein product [Owenia fusiformis]|uniref:Uncharacterized protein n=1 Tax=Owenia fusiformis TaxID=6347 RepID=A0A8J1UK61_OWEFU|nr:unnamed protein product [Owenia fusiformis]